MNSSNIFTDLSLSELLREKVLFVHAESTIKQM